MVTVKQCEETGVLYYDDAYVYPVGQTQVHCSGTEAFLRESGLALPEGRTQYTQPCELPELAGRLCYMSFGKQGGRKTNTEYLTHILEAKHFSVIEHVNFSVIIRGGSRGFTHEAVRHRHLSVSQFSTRYCDKIAFVVPCMLREDYAKVRQYLKHCAEALQRYKACYNELYAELKAASPTLDKLSLRKRARGAARSYLPIGVEAPIMLTGNVRTWREVFEKRISPAAEAEIRNIMQKVKVALGCAVGEVFLKGL